ncbi:hypothetical protein KR009_011415, partial [Drosophila setifemur]
VVHPYLIIQFTYYLLIVPEVQGKPWRGGPGSNSGPIGGPAWNGGPDESTDNIILHSNGKAGKWRY